MNRMVLVSILCVMSVFGMAAQNDSIMTRAVSNNSTYYGVQGNIGINSISASNLTQHNKPDFGGGFYISHMRGSLLMETGVNWTTRKLDLTGFIPQYTDIISLNKSLNYIDVPLKLGLAVKFFNRDTQKVSAIIAPHVGMYVGCLVNDRLDGFRRWDVGGKVGIDFYIRRIRIGFDYTRGWVDINKHIDRHVKTKSFDFSIGWTFATHVAK